MFKKNKKLHRAVVAMMVLCCLVCLCFTFAYAAGSENDAAPAAEPTTDVAEQQGASSNTEAITNFVNETGIAQMIRQADWIFAGDFNSRSRIDNWFYNIDEASTALITQDEILENTDYVDVIAEGYKGHFISSTQGNSRIDYVYMSPSLYRDVKSACTVMDIWTLAYKAGTTGFYYPSDHRPVMVDLQF